MPTFRALVSVVDLDRGAALLSTAGITVPGRTGSATRPAPGEIRMDTLICAVDADSEADARKVIEVALPP
jgi:hypothetical protein